MSSEKVAFFVSFDLEKLREIKLLIDAENWEAVHEHDVVFDFLETVDQLGTVTRVAIPDHYLTGVTVEPLQEAVQELDERLSEADDS